MKHVSGLLAQANLAEDAQILHAERTLHAHLTEPLTWERLIELEPELAALWDEIGRVADDGEAESFCANQRWHEDFRPELLGLVGWMRRPFHPILSTSAAYDIAYHKLCDRLPPCRHDAGL